MVIERRDGGTREIIAQREKEQSPKYAIALHISSKISSQPVGPSINFTKSPFP